MNALKEEQAVEEEEAQEVRQQIIELNMTIRSQRTDVAQIKRQIDNLEREISSLKREMEGKERPARVRNLMDVQRELNEVRVLLSEYQDVSEVVAHQKEKLSERLEQLAEKSLELRQELEAAELAVRHIKDQYHNNMSEKLQDIERRINSILAEISFPGQVRLILKVENNEYGVEFKAKIKHGDFREIRAGSGGEKSLLSLGLILALQKINSTPTYALDEIDVFLDSTNSDKIARLIKNASRRSQFIVITPAKSVYLLKRADKLIGIVSPSPRQPPFVIEGPRYEDDTDDEDESEDNEDNTEGKDDSEDNDAEDQTHENKDGKEKDDDNNT